MQVDFYQLGAAPLEQVIASIAGRSCLAKGKRLLIVAGGRGAAWRGSTACCGTRAPTSFLPHGLAGGSDDARQPILLSTECRRAQPRPQHPDRRRRVARGGAGLRPRLLPVRRRDAGRRAACLEAACRAGRRRAPLLGAGRRASGCRRPEPCPRRAGAARGAANPQPTDFMETARPWRLPAPFRSSSPTPPAAT